MCVVSMIMDHYQDRWKDRQPLPYYPSQPPFGLAPINIPSQEEIYEFRKLLERAREYDKKNNEPDCEMEEKKKKLLDLAKELRIDISFV